MSFIGFIFVSYSKTEPKLMPAPLNLPHPEEALIPALPSMISIVFKEYHSLSLIRSFSWNTLPTQS